VDLGFLSGDPSAGFAVDSPLCRAFSTADQQRKAAALRLLLEAYHPYVVFKERLRATNDAAAAARQVKELLDLDPHADAVKDTLLSLGQYTQSLVTEAGGYYRESTDGAEHHLTKLAKACADDASAEARILSQLGGDAPAYAPRDKVIGPLATALQRAAKGEGREAVVYAGNAVESFLTLVGGHTGTAMKGTGINAKALELESAGVLAKKQLNVSKYLGHVRNAADHGVDTDVASAWDILESTGIEYVFVACSFIRSVIMKTESKDFWL
jgi:hypothetical protein